jgi:outer membrane lipoprotein LolB
MKRLTIRGFGLFAVVLLAACAGVGAPKPDAPAGFDLGGRIAARYQERAFSSALRWKHGAGSDEIWLTAPLGQTLAHLFADADGATLTAADQKKYRANSIESLTRSALGWRFPVAGMRFWVLGQTAPGMPLAAVERDVSNRITRFQQGEFQITLVYAQAGAARPQRMEISGGDAEIRLVIDSLTVGQP